MPRNHFDITNYGNNYDYNSKQTSYNDSDRIPQRDRIAHSQRVLSMFHAALESDRQYCNEAHTRTNRQGYYLKFQNQRGSILALKQIDNRRIGHLINVKENGLNDEKNIEATLFLKDSSQTWIDDKVREYQDLNTIKGEPRNHKLINTIENISCAHLEDFWMGNEIDSIPRDNKEWIEVWFYNQDQLLVNNERIDDFKNLLREYNIEFKNSFLLFPERVVMTIHANYSDMLRVLAVSEDVMAFSPCPMVAGFIAEVERGQQNDWGIMINDDFTAPEETDLYICLLDSGVNYEHPLLHRIINQQDCIAVIDDWGLRDNENHGTLMAGTLIYGDLSDYIHGHNANTCNYKLCSVKLLSHTRHNEVLWAQYAQQAVSKIEINKPNKRLLFCSTVTDKNGSLDGSATTWSSVMDKMAAEENNQRLFIISGGSIKDSLQWYNYPSSNFLTPIKPPAQAWNALTVCAYTQKTNFIDDHGSQRQVLASYNGLSPFSTTSMLWIGVKDRPIKPDIVMEGGNVYQTDDPTPQNKYSTNSNLEILSTSAQFQNRNLFDTYSGTSPATALAARYAAIVAAQYPDYWPETIRGLFVQSAVWKPQMVQDYPNVKERLRVFGYGVPSLERMLNSVNQGVTFISQSTLQPYRNGPSGPVFNNMHIYSLPWPKETLLGMGEAIVRMSVTLSYFIEPAPGKFDNYSAYNYASVGLRFDINNPEENIEQLRNRISLQERYEDRRNVVHNDSSRWCIGIKKRTHGSIHKDFIETTAAELASCNNIVVYPVSGWWKNRRKLGCYDRSIRYSLIVSLDTDEVECNLLTEIESIINPMVEIEA